MKRRGIYEVTMTWAGGAISPCMPGLSPVRVTGPGAVNFDGFYSATNSATWSRLETKVARSYNIHLRIN